MAPARRAAAPVWRFVAPRRRLVASFQRELTTFQRGAASFRRGAAAERRFAAPFLETDALFFRWGTALGRIPFSRVAAVADFRTTVGGNKV